MLLKAKFAVKFKLSRFFISCVISFQLFFSPPVKFERLDHRHPLVNRSSPSISAAHALHVAFAAFVCSHEQEGEAVRHRGATELSGIVSFIRFAGKASRTHSSIKHESVFGSC